MIPYLPLRTSLRGRRVRDADFERLFGAHAQPLYGFLVYRTGDRALAEDVLAEAFERAYRGRAVFDRRRASEKTWLYAIALNVARDYQRRRAAESRAYERAGDVARAVGAVATLASVEDRYAVRAPLARLGPEEREVIALRFGADLTVPEISTLLNEKRTTVEGRLYRALRKLRDMMAAPAEAA